MATKSRKPEIKVFDTDDRHPSSYGRHEILMPRGTYTISTIYAMDREIFETAVFDSNGHTIGRTEYSGYGLSPEEVRAKHNEIVSRIQSGKLKIEEGMEI